MVGCHRPPVPTHGSTEGLFHHSGARITFRCDPGFELRGFGTAICLSDGTWSAPAPECGKIMMGIVFSTNKFKCGFWSSHMCFCLSLNAIQYILPQRWCTFWKKTMEKGQFATPSSLIFLFCLQCQWKKSALYHPSQHMVTTSWFMDPMMSSLLYSTCASSPMNSVGAPREPASLTTPGVGPLLFAHKVRQGVLNKGV